MVPSKVRHTRWLNWDYIFCVFSISPTRVGGFCALWARTLEECGRFGIDLRKGFYLTSLLTACSVRTCLDVSSGFPPEFFVEPLSLISFCFMLTARSFGRHSQLDGLVLHFLKSAKFFGHTTTGGCFLGLVLRNSNAHGFSSFRIGRLFDTQLGTHITG